MTLSGIPFRKKSTDAFGAFVEASGSCIGLGGYVAARAFYTCVSCHEEVLNRN